jgi:hypothetical protein
MTPCGALVEFRGGAPVAPEPTSELLEVDSIEGEMLWGRIREFTCEPPSDSGNFELDGPLSQ